MPPLTSKPSDSNKDEQESSDHELPAASGEEQTCTATEQPDCTQAASTTTTTARNESEAEVHEPAENVSSVESSVEIAASPRAAVESSDSDQCCGGAAAMSADDENAETADIIGAAAQLLRVGVHLLKAVARDQPPSEETSELQAPPGEGTRLVHAVKEFLINPELLQPEQAAAEILREVNRPRRQRRSLPLQMPGESRRDYYSWLAFFVILMIGIVALFVYIGYTSWYMFVERPSK